MHYVYSAQYADFLNEMPVWPTYYIAKICSTQPEHTAMHSTWPTIYGVKNEPNSNDLKDILKSFEITK